MGFYGLALGRSRANLTPKTSTRSTLETYQHSASNLKFVQSPETVGLSRTTSFTINNDLHMMVTNDRDLCGSYATYQINIHIYRMKVVQTHSKSCKRARPTKQLISQ